MSRVERRTNAGAASTAPHGACTGLQSFCSFTQMEFRHYKTYIKHGRKYPKLVLYVISNSSTWYPKHPFFNGCFSWMIPKLYIKNGGFIKHCCLGFQVLDHF